MRVSKGQATYGMLSAIVQALAALVITTTVEAKTLKLVALGDSLTAG